MRPPARAHTVRSARPQPRRAARCARRRILRAVGELHRAARVLHGKRTWLCTARAVCHHAVHACDGQTTAGECDREPLDVEDGATPTSRTTPFASLPPTVPRRAWQIANSVSQLLTSDPSGRGNRAWHTTTLNVNKAKRIAALLQPTGKPRRVRSSDPRPTCSDAVTMGAGLMTAASRAHG